MNGCLDFYRTWWKQLLVAKEARRTDILSLRLSLAHRILLGTEVYKEVQKIVETALKLLENEVGSLDHVYASMTRGIVSRLSCGAEVQRLCTTALECFDSKFSVLFSICLENKDAPSKLPIIYFRGQLIELSKCKAEPEIIWIFVLNTL